MKLKIGFSKLWHRLRYVSGHIDGIIDNSVDILSTKQLSPLINTYPYLPYTKASLRYSSITYLLNDIIINNRKVVVEFGSGISTIIICRLIKQLGLKDIVLFSVDHNKEWLAIVENCLKTEMTDLAHVHLINAELTSSELSANNLDWYNTEKIQCLLDDYKGKVDCVLVDGPIATLKEASFIRYPALPFIYDYLATNCSVFLDDTDRDAEKSIQQQWTKKYNLQVKQLNSSFTRLGRGASFGIK